MATGVGIQLLKFGYTDASLTNLDWSFVSANALPRFYDANEDSPSKPTTNWRLEIEAGDIDAEVAHSLELLGDRQAQRVTFRCGDAWALKFPNAKAYMHFWNDYNNKLFENIYGATNTQANREEHLGRDFASKLFTEDEKEEDMDWQEEVTEDDVKQEDARHDTNAKDPLVGDKDISLIKLGIGNKSYSVRGQNVSVLQNISSGVEDTGQDFTLCKPDGTVVKPSVVMLADCERKMGMLHEGDAHSLLYADVESGKVVQECRFKKDDVDIPMTEIVAETKSAPAEDRSTFLSYDRNRLCRWDMRDPTGIVQQHEPALDFIGGKDYAQYTNFTSMATTGDGSVVVGSADGKIRLYSNKLTLKRASTAFPGIGTPITHIDVTYDGKWVIATTDHFIEIIKTTAKDADGKSVEGYRKSLASLATRPKLLKLKPEDTIRTGHAPLRKGRFTFVTEASHQERWIVATCGSYSVLWNFRQVKMMTNDHRASGGLPTCVAYHLVCKDEPVVDSCFSHESRQSGSQSEAALVVATQHKVWSFYD